MQEKIIILQHDILEEMPVVKIGRYHIHGSV